MQNNLYEHFNLSGHSGFLSGISVVDKTEHERISGFANLKPKYHWDVMLKMVFRHYLLNLLH